ncbi:MAG: carbamoyltransferase HypF [Dechloromonas sp.]|nr:carbamoyltransferase HypF [Dechloromonas sp.]
MSGVRLFIRGLVQGVGFRPYVWRLASELGLNGWVRNEGAGVSVAVDGAQQAEFQRRLPLEMPAQARIDAIEQSACTVDASGFDILDSVAGEMASAIGADGALCPACAAEVCDPGNRRWRYPFTTCTHCGPRYTVSAGLPYDRSRTSLAPFALCPACASEYRDPVDRRFHAETTCCPACGPQLRLLGEDGRAVDGDPLAETLARLQAGQIVAIKGLGGFHLACDARNPEALATLRERKMREAKPFAVMGLNPASLTGVAQLDAPAVALLAGPAAPIVLCRKGAQELYGVAPGLGELGVMFPSTPLHLLLWHEAAGRPAGKAWMDAPAGLLLVMTSANPQGEPLVIGNDEARERLRGIADAFLLHDRDIVVRCDDSVVRAGAVGPTFIRRSRGHVPLPIPLAKGGPTVLALGGHLKNTICVFKGQQAFLSQHVGSLDNAASIAFLEETVAHLLSILDVRPDLVAHDLHPDDAAGQLAVQLAGQWGVPALAIPHHHAHLAAICAEHGSNTPVIGLAIDGVGMGPDGGAWGGELLRLDGAGCVRLGHLRPLALPGGDRAAREPWRMGVSALHAAGLGYRVGGWLSQRHPCHEGGSLLTMLARRLRSPETSSLGRWFDAAAGLLGLCSSMSYEGQAAMLLEAQALAQGPVAPIAGGYQLSADGRVLDFTPLVLPLLDCRDPALGAAQFHATVAAGLAAWLLAAVDRENCREIVVGGGCAMNAVLMAALRDALAEAGLSLREARQAPPNDGGLALGQAWVARAIFKEGKHVSGDTGAGR